jgi:hypothetical protein
MSDPGLLFIRTTEGTEVTEETRHREWMVLRALRVLCGEAAEQ